MTEAISRAELHTHESVESWAKGYCGLKGWKIQHNNKNIGLRPAGALAVELDNRVVLVNYLLPANIVLLERKIEEVMVAFESR